MHPVEDIRVSSWQWTGWTWCNYDAHGKQVDDKQLYNPVPQRVELVGISCSWSSSCSSRQWEPAEGWALRTPVEQPAEWERSAAKDRGTWGQYVAVCSVSNSPLTHNPFATLSNKVWEVYFSKEVGLFMIIVDYVSACICI